MGQVRRRPANVMERNSLPLPCSYVCDIRSGTHKHAQPSDSVGSGLVPLNTQQHPRPPRGQVGSLNSFMSYVSIPFLAIGDRLAGLSTLHIYMSVPCMETYRTYINMYAESIHACQQCTQVQPARNQPFFRLARLPPREWHISTSPSLLDLLSCNLDHPIPATRPARQPASLSIYRSVFGYRIYAGGQNVSL